MQLLKDRIRKDGKIKAGSVLKVDSFLNHQMDITLFGEIGKEFKRRFADAEINKILTIEAVSYTHLDVYKRQAPGCSSCTARCGNTDNYDMRRLWDAPEDIRSLKSLILFGIRGMAAYAYHAMVLGYTSEEVNSFFYKALFVLAEDWGMEELLPVVMEAVSYTHLDVYKRQVYDS